MAKAVIIVSDLHLGRGDVLDNFRPVNEKAFVSFLDTKAGELKGGIDLVLLGDTFDVWQVAPDVEKKARHSKQIDVSVSVSSEGSRMNGILLQHKPALETLGRFLQTDAANRTLYFVIGNHDHSLVDPRFQQMVREAVSDQTNIPHDQIVFAHYYDRPDLAMYAEHGHQYEASNKYDLVNSFTPECPGYYFVRLFYNRMETVEPRIGCWGSWFQIFETIWDHHLIKYLPKAYELFGQYRKDKRVPKLIDIMGIPVPRTKAPSQAPKRNRLPEFPDLLFTGTVHPNNIFSLDPGTENRLRGLYHSDDEFRTFVDRVIRKKYKKSPPAVPIEPVPGTKGLFDDDYAIAITRMFGTSPAGVETMPVKGEPLDPDVYKHVVFGHTHDDKTNILSNCTYHNTGSWCYKEDSHGKNISRLCYLTVTQRPDGGIDYQTDCWPNP